MRGRVGVLFSGGLDSAILVGHLLRQGRHVQPLFIRSHLCWQAAEERAVASFLAALASPRLAELVVLEMPLGDLYAGHWSVTGRQVPDETSADEAVYLPGRNALLIVKAAVWCRLRGVEELALGVLGANPFADATDAFFSDLEAALNAGPGVCLRITRPFAALSKREVMRLGRGLPLERTFSCLAPVDGLHCGRCNKCGERMAAFRSAATADPTRYADPAAVAR